MKNTATSVIPFSSYRQVLRPVRDMYSDRSTDAATFIGIEELAQFNVPQEPEEEDLFGRLILFDEISLSAVTNSIISWNQDVADRIQGLFDEIPRSGPLADEIGSFLCKNPDLIEVIDETMGKIPSYFGDDASLELRLLMDDEDDVTLLTLAVRTSLDVDSAFYALNKFEDEWYFKRFDEAITNFIIDITFK